MLLSDSALPYPHWFELHWHIHKDELAPINRTDAKIGFVRHLGRVASMQVLFEEPGRAIDQICIHATAGANLVRDLNARLQRSDVDGRVLMKLDTVASFGTDDLQEPVGAVFERKDTLLDSWLEVRCVWEDSNLDESHRFVFRRVLLGVERP